MTETHYAIEVSPQKGRPWLFVQGLGLGALLWQRKAEAVGFAKDYAKTRPGIHLRVVRVAVEWEGKP